jgi:hypothetical protein
VHSKLSSFQIEACRLAQRPVPPADAVRIEDEIPGSARGDDVYDWGHPGDFELCTRDSPVCFRWRFRGGELITFAGYGWLDGRKDHRGRISAWYGLLPAPMRDAAASKLFSEIS